MLGVVLAAGLGGLAGCGEPDVEPDALQRWMSEEEAVDVPGALMVVAGLAGRVDEAEPGDGVTATFDDAATVTSVRFACRGPRSMSADITIAATGAGGGVLSQTVRIDDIRCDGDPHPLAAAQDAVTAVTVNGLSPSAQGAWVARALGEG